VRLLSLNEVGGDPGRFGSTPEAFHAGNAERLRDWPYAMIATATHDTKRGEDARGRLDALSEMPQAWTEALDLWREVAKPHLATIEGSEAPDANDRYMLLQALLEAWPMELLEDASETGLADFRARMEGYATKALREAKRHTSWVNVDAAYEAAALGLVRGLLDPGGAFLDRFRPLARRLARLGMINGLARTALKCALPGVPDVYQGTELWDLSLVDPDNRRPVDYAARMRALNADEIVDALLARWPDGRIKQRVLARCLADRAARPALYAEGAYEALAAEGERGRHVLAFLRTHGHDRLVVAVPRLVARMADEALPLGRAFWRDTSLPMPTGRWRDVVTGVEIEAAGGGHPVRELFAALPIAVLRTLA
jgi:(1->4)-alpha-D-glucan 1-alpha-D-glucosylmutase